MKELSIEEKSARYDKALERVNSKWHYRNQPCVVDIAEIFPELKESEDERIRKTLIKFFSKGAENNSSTNGISDKDILAWLEKQKTSEEALQYLRENHSSSEISDFQAAMNISVAKAYDKGKADAINTMKTEWSEDDEYNREHLLGWINTLKTYIHHDALVSIDLRRKRIDEVTKFENWFKSLKERVQPQNRWKPSEDQIDALAGLFRLAKSCGEECAFYIRTLHEQLKKLRCE